MKSSLAHIFSTLAIFTSTAHAATVYNIDIGPSGGGVEPGYTELVSTFNGSGGSVTIDGDTFTLVGQGGARDRGVAGPVGINEVSADFAFKEAGDGGIEMSLNMGAAGALQAGIWELSVYSYDSNVPIEDQIIGLYTNGASPVIYGAAVDGTLIGPALTFQFTSDGTSAYSLFLRDSTANPTTGTDSTDKVRLNGIDLVFIPEPSSLVLSGLGALVLFRRRR